MTEKPKGGRIDLAKFREVMEAGRERARANPPRIVSRAKLALQGRELAMRGSGIPRPLAARNQEPGSGGVHRPRALMTFILCSNIGRSNV